MTASDTRHEASPGPSFPEVARSEREALARTLLAADPTGTTLCAGWDVRDLCVHLVLFQRRPDSWLAVPVGNRVGRVQRFYDRLVDAERARPWAQLVEQFSVGPAHGLFASDARRDRVFFREHVVHHEDVRRALGLAPRPDIETVQAAVWERLTRFVRMVEPKDVAVTFRWPGVAETSARDGASRVELAGEPVELLLHLFGRDTGGTVAVSGDAAHASRIRDTSGLAALPRLTT